MERKEGGRKERRKERKKEKRKERKASEKNKKEMSVGHESEAMFYAKPKMVTYFASEPIDQPSDQ